MKHKDSSNTFPTRVGMNRERELLGRPLGHEEVREVTRMAQRIAAILLLEPRLDENYRASRDDAYPWPSESG